MCAVRLLRVIHTATRSTTVHNEDGTIGLVREDGSIDGDDVLPGLRIPVATRLLPQAT